MSPSIPNKDSVPDLSPAFDYIESRLRPPPLRSFRIPSGNPVASIRLLDNIDQYRDLFGLRFLFRGGTTGNSVDGWLFLVLNSSASEPFHAWLHRTFLTSPAAPSHDTLAIVNAGTVGWGPFLSPTNWNSNNDIFFDCIFSHTTGSYRYSRSNFMNLSQIGPGSKVAGEVHSVWESNTTVLKTVDLVIGASVGAKIYGDIVVEGVYGPGNL